MREASRCPCSAASELRHPGLQHRPALPGQREPTGEGRQSRSVIPDPSWTHGTAVPPAEPVRYQRCIPVPNASHSGPAHADDDGVPGDHLASMTIPGDFAPGESTPADLITVAPAPHQPEYRDTLLDRHQQRSQENNILSSQRDQNPKWKIPLPSKGWDDRQPKSQVKNQTNSWANPPSAPIQMAILGSPPFIRDRRGRRPRPARRQPQRPQNGRSRNPRHRQHWPSDRKASIGTTVYTATTGGSTQKRATDTASR